MVLFSLSLKCFITKILQKIEGNTNGQIFLQGSEACSDFVQIENWSQLTATVIKQSFIDFNLKKWIRARLSTHKTAKFMKFNSNSSEIEH